MELRCGDDVLLVMHLQARVHRLVPNVVCACAEVEGERLVK